MAGPGEVMRGLKIAQLRRTAQNEIHRREEQLGEYETGGEGNRELTSTQRLLVLPMI